MDGEAFKIQSAMLIGGSIDGEGHAIINFIHTDGSITKTLGIDFEYSADLSISGTYSYPQNNSDRYLDEWLTNYTIMSQSSVESDTHLKEGTVTIKDNGGSNYTVTMDLLMEDGTVFKGKYQGKFVTQFNNQ